MARNSKELVADLFAGKQLERIPFLPWVCGFAAKLEQVPVNAMLSDPGVLTRALSNAQKLFGYDVILNHFDPTLEAEACGCEVNRSDDEWSPRVSMHPLENGGDFYDLDTDSIETKGRIPVVFEATKRLILTKGKEVPIAALVNGPLSLALQLKGDSLIEGLEQEDDDALDLLEDAGNLCLKLARAYCELGVDIVVVAEDLKGKELPDAVQVLASPLKSIFNVIRFYNIKSILISSADDPAQAAALAGLGSDGVSISGYTSETSVHSSIIPDAAFLGNDPEQLDIIGKAAQSGGQGVFLSSDGEVPYATDVNRMHAIMKVILGN